MGKLCCNPLKILPKCGFNTFFNSIPSLLSVKMPRNLRVSVKSEYLLKISMLAKKGLRCTLIANPRYLKLTVPGTVFELDGIEATTPLR